MKKRDYYEARRMESARQFFVTIALFVGSGIAYVVFNIVLYLFKLVVSNETAIFAFQMSTIGILTIGVIGGLFLSTKKQKKSYGIR